MSVFEGGDAQYVCRVCSSGDSHPLAKCLKFLAFRTEDRIRAVALYKYCANCLAHTHYGRGCSSTSKCHKCRGDHHTFLHERDSSAKEARSSAKEARSQGRSGTSSTSKSSSRRKSSRASKTSNSNQKGRVHFESRARRSARDRQTRAVSETAQREATSRPTSAPPLLTTLIRAASTRLYPTAMVTFKIDGRRRLLRCVIDQCQPVSRIAASTAKEYRIGTLKYSGECVCRVDFEERYPERRVSTVNLVVCAAKKSLSPSADVDKGLAMHYMGIDLADRRFYRSQHVDVIFGADLYAKVLMEGVLKKPGLPLAQMTVFGWVLSGACPT